MPERRTTPPGHSPRRGGHCNWSKGGNWDEPVANPSKRPREAPILIASDVAVSNRRAGAPLPSLEIGYVEGVIWQADVQLLCYVEYLAIAPVHQEVGVARDAARYPGCGKPIRKIHLPGHLPANFRKQRAIKMSAVESARAHQSVARRRRLRTLPGIRYRHATSLLMARRRLRRLPDTGRSNQRQRGCRNKSAPHASRYTNELQWRARRVERGSLHPEFRSAVAIALIESWIPSATRGSASPARWRLSNSIWSRLSGSI
jgi:hypothetical protein